MGRGLLSTEKKASKSSTFTPDEEVDEGNEDDVPRTSEVSTQSSNIDNVRISAVRLESGREGKGKGEKDPAMNG